MGEEKKRNKPEPRTWGYSADVKAIRAKVRARKTADALREDLEWAREYAAKLLREAGIASLPKSSGLAQLEFRLQAALTEVKRLRDLDRRIAAFEAKAAANG